MVARIGFWSAPWCVSAVPEFTVRPFHFLVQEHVWALPAFCVLETALLRPFLLVCFSGYSGLPPGVTGLGALLAQWPDLLCDPIPFLESL